MHSSTVELGRVRWATAPARWRHAHATTAGVAAILGAALLWSTIGLTDAWRPTSADPLSVGGLRITLGGAVLVAVAGIRGQLGPVVSAVRIRAAGIRGVRTHPLLWILLGSAAVATYQVGLFTAMDRAGVAVGTVVSMSTPPLLVGLASALLRRRRPRATWVVATTLSITGCAVLGLPGSATRVDPFGAIMAGVAGASFALYSTACSRLIRDGLPVTAVMGVLFAVGGVGLLPVSISSGIAWVATPRGLVVLLYLAVATTAVAYWLFGVGLRTVSVTTSSTLSLADPFGAALLGLSVLGEPASPLGLAGLGMMLVGLVLTARTT